MVKEFAQGSGRAGRQTQVVSAQAYTLTLVKPQEGRDPPYLS